MPEQRDHVPMQSVHDVLQLILISAVQHAQNDEVAVRVARQLQYVRPQLVEDGRPLCFRTKLDQRLEIGEQGGGKRLSLDFSLQLTSDPSQGYIRP